MRLSIRWQLVAIMCGVILMAFAAFMAIVRYVIAEEYEPKAQASDMQLARVLARNIGESMRTSLVMERVIADYPSLLDMPEQEQRAFLQRMRQENPAYDLLAVVDMEGRQVARSIGKNEDRSDREWFRKFRETGTGSISNAYYSSSTRNIVVTLVQGIYRAGSPQGLIMAAISTESIRDFIHSYNQESECMVYLLDQTGTSIAQPKELGDGIFNYVERKQLRIRRDGLGNAVYDAKGELALEQVPFEPPPGLARVVQDALGGAPGTGSYAEQGERYLCVYQPVEIPAAGAQWILLLVRPYSTLLSAMSDLMHRLALGGALMALLASVGAILFSKRITRPIFEIAEMAKRVRAGDLSGEIPIQRQDEIGVLVGTINHMVRGLRKTEEKNRKAEAQIRDMAYHDALTGLPNRTHFMIYARDVLHRALKRRKPGAVLFIDVDKFKLVNDTYGHAAGDSVLVSFGKRTVELAGRKEQVCRFGGDEFIVILPDLDEAAVGEACRALVEKMREPFRIPDDQELQLSASIGAAQFPKDASTIDGLLQCADAALYRSKRNGRDQYNIYETGMQVEEN